MWMLLEINLKRSRAILCLDTCKHLRDSIFVLVLVLRLTNCDTEMFIFPKAHFIVFFIVYIQCYCAMKGQCAVYFLPSPHPQDLDVHKTGFWLNVLYIYYLLCFTFLTYCLTWCCFIVFPFQIFLFLFADRLIYWFNHLTVWFSCFM